jgi:hypothetical protein
MGSTFLPQLVIVVAVISAHFFELEANQKYISAKHTRDSLTSDVCAAQLPRIRWPFPNVRRSSQNTAQDALDALNVVAIADAPAPGAKP